MTSKADNDYWVLVDAIHLVRQVIKHGDRWRNHVSTNRLVDCEIEKAQTLLDEARKQIDDLFVLARVSEFERRLRDVLKNVLTENFNPSDDTLRNISKAIQEDIDFWGLSDQLISVHATVQANLKGQAKQVLGYRDWVAHGHKYGEEQQLPEANVTPQRAGDVLDRFLQQAGIEG